MPEKLSRGEKQLVDIARALVNQPDIILTDEPTANLDSHHGYETMRLLRSIAKEENRCMIIVSHDQHIKDIVDRVLWLEDGEFKARPPHDLLPEKRSGLTLFSLAKFLSTAAPLSLAPPLW